MKGIRTMQPTLTLLTALLLLPLGVLNAAEFHVASSGNDANPGTKDQPFLTLELVREATRQIKETGPLKKPVTVFVRGGTYRLQASLILGMPDSGTELHPSSGRRHRVRRSGCSEVRPYQPTRSSL